MVGANDGPSLGTNISYPIRFSAHRCAAGVVSSVDMLGTGTRDVEISAPPQVKGASASAAFNNGVTINGA